MAKAKTYDVGMTFTSNNFGDYEITECLPERKCRIRFKDTGVEHIVHQGGIRSGMVKDPSRPLPLRSKRLDIGDTFQTKRHGFVKVIERAGPNEVVVEFMNTGFRKTYEISDVLRGYLRDDSVPFKYTNGDFKDPKKGSLNIKVGDTYFTNSGDEYEVLEKINSNNITIRFLKHGNTKVVRSSNIRWGKIYNCMRPSYKNIGYIGTDNTTDPVIISLWHGIISRHCSDEYASTICPEWLNYSTFAEDIRHVINFEQWYGLRKQGVSPSPFHLDKDLKKFGNTIYSPDTVMFISAEDNNAESHIRKAISTTGIESTVGKILLKSHRELAFKYTNVVEPSEG